MKNVARYLTLYLILHFIPTTFLVAQSEDFQSWSGLILSKKINPKTTISNVSIVRFTDNSSRFNDVSFDWRVSRKIKGKFHAQVSFRNWPFTEQKPVYFAWYDIKHVQQKEQYKWVNLLRFHHGLDWNDKKLADFLRWRNFYFQKFPNSRFVPYVGYDLWFRFNGKSDFQILWLEAGSEYHFDKLKLKLNYRRIGYFGNIPGLRRHLIVTWLIYSF